MDDEIATYSFLPWLREGISNNISAPTDPTAKRGKIAVTLKIDGTGVDGGADISASVQKNVELYGPGDIVGIDSKAIVKTEPRNWITNFEPNYLPYIDFSDPDFLWRYTPSAASGERLTPWLTLIILGEDEFTDGKNILNRPLHYIQIDETLNLADVMPPSDSLWAWGHVHTNKDIVGDIGSPVSTNENAFITKLQTTISANPDLAYCRLLASRKLDENTPYHAFVIPTFESGRLAGLGLDPMLNSDYSANTISWESYASREEPKLFPVYHRWFFRTSSAGDFEYLVRLLKPKIADSRVGHRDIDVLAPGSNISGITDERLKGILRLGGALRFPVNCLAGEQKTNYENYDQWYDSHPHQFQEEVAAFINLADDYQNKNTQTAHNESDLTIEDAGSDPDPLITPPFYARWHAMLTRILKNSDGSLAANNKNWVHQLNLDPRWRSSANFGTKVVQENQESYMDAAWGQVGEILEANRKFNLGKLAVLASNVWYVKNILPVGIFANSAATVASIPSRALEKTIMRTAPMHKRIISSGQTVSYAMQSTTVPHALVSAPMRRVLRPRGRLASKLTYDAKARPDNLLERVNNEEVSAAPPRETPEGIVTLNDVADSVGAAYAPKALKEILKKYPWLQYLPLVLGFVIILLGFLFGVLSLAGVGVVLSVAIGLFLLLRKIMKDTVAAESILPENQTPEAVDTLPASPDFRVTEVGDSFRPSYGGSTDSAEAARFKDALRNSFDFVNRSAEAGKLPSYEPLNVPALVSDTIVALNPTVTIPRYLFGHIELPPHIFEALNEKFVEVMAYPVLDIPMYEPLLKMGTDNFLPNLNLIEKNSITLLETNQQFIESYMVGINHEFVRELRWRQFPTDMRPTPFRQFWDVSNVINKDDLDDEALRESLRDIPPLHRWSKFSELGDHDQREAQGDKEEEVVLVIRGELLKKYPTAVIYAHRAKWAVDEFGERDLTKPREFDEEGELVNLIKTPLYQAKAEPDIYFFGFDITVIDAKGGSGEEDDDDPGWFFVIKERPGEPRFGLDVPSDQADFNEAKVDSWNDLTWSHVIENVSAGSYLSLNGPRSISVDAPAGPLPSEGEERDAAEQKQEDSNFSWDNTINSAELAYILYQVPVLIGVHSAEMLPDECGV